MTGGNRSQCGKSKGIFHGADIWESKTIENKITKECNVFGIISLSYILRKPFPVQQKQIQQAYMRGIETKTTDFHGPLPKCRDAIYLYVPCGWIVNLYFGNISLLTGRAVNHTQEHSFHGGRTRVAMYPKPYYPSAYTFGYSATRLMWIVKDVHESSRFTRCKNDWWHPYQIWRPLF